MRTSCKNNKNSQDSMLNCIITTQMNYYYSIRIELRILPSNVWFFFSLLFIASASLSVYAPDTFILLLASIGLYLYYFCVLSFVVLCATCTLPTHQFNGVYHFITIILFECSIIVKSKRNIVTICTFLYCIPSFHAEKKFIRK